MLLHSSALLKELLYSAINRWTLTWIPTTAVCRSIPTAEITNDFSVAERHLSMFALGTLPARLATKEAAE